MNGWLMFGLGLIVLGAVIRIFAETQPQPEPALMVACTDGKTYRDIDIMMVMEGKTVLFTKTGQRVIPSNITCNGRVQQ